MIGDQTGAAIIGAASNAVGSAFGAHWAKESQKRAQKFAIHMAKHRHQYEAQDLEEAGLNRILSITQGGPMAAPGAHSTPQGMDLAGGARALGMMKAEWKRMAADRRLKDATAFNQSFQGKLARLQKELFNETYMYKKWTAQEEYNRAHWEALTAKQLSGRMTQDRLIREMEMPKHKALSQFYSNPAGKGSLWWSEFMKNLAGPLNLSGSASTHTGKSASEVIMRRP